MPPLNKFSQCCITLAIGHASLVTTQAAIITVNTHLDDDGSGCTLREAIEQSNVTVSLGNGCLEGSVGTDMITFSDTLTTNTITLTQGSLFVGSNKVIEISARSVLGGIILTGNSLSRVLTTSSSTVLNIDSLTISGGSASRGGGMYLNGSTVSLSNSEVSENFASGLGAGIYAGNSSSLTIDNSRVSNNRSNSGGGGIFARSSSLAIENSTLISNSANSVGGGIYTNASPTEIIESTISENSAQDGGGIFLFSGSNASIERSTLANNTAFQKGGAIYASIASASLLHSTPLYYQIECY